MILKACEILMLFPFTDEALFSEICQIYLIGTERVHFYSFSSPLYLRKHTMGTEGKKKKHNTIMWNILQIYLNYFKCICLITGSSNCFKTFSLLVLSRSWYLVLHCSPLLAKASRLAPVPETHQKTEVVFNLFIKLERTLVEVGCYHLWSGPLLAGLTLQ